MTNQEIIVGGQKTNLIIYDQSVDDNVEPSLKTTKGQYVFDVILGNDIDIVYIKALIFTSVNQIYLIYHPQSISGNLEQIISTKTTQVISTEELFEELKDFFNLSCDGNILSDYLKEKFNIKDSVIDLSKSVQEFIKDGSIFQRSQQVLNELQNQKLVKTKEDEKLWDQNKQNKQQQKISFSSKNTIGQKFQQQTDINKENYRKIKQILAGLSIGRALLFPKSQYTLISLLSQLETYGICDLAEIAVDNQTNYAVNVFKFREAQDNFKQQQIKCYY